MPSPHDIGKMALGIRMCRSLLHPLVGIVAVACLIALVGWLGAINGLLHCTTVVIGLLFGLERLWLFRHLRLDRNERHRLKVHAVVAGIVLLASMLLALESPSGPNEWPLAGHGGILAAVSVSCIASMIHHQTRFTARAFHPGMVLVVSFAFIIVAGGCLLKMPRCTLPGHSCSWLDAFFTSTSAVCVTGLTVQNTPIFFSMTGQVIILLLIQVGGVGIMTLTFFAAVVMFEGLTLHDRLLLGRMIQENRLARITRTLIFIVVMTFGCEAVGAVVLFASLDTVPEFGMRWFHAVFHSVSAFCNAGFSTLPDNLASREVAGNPIWQSAIMILIVIGGLGSLVNEDASLWLVGKWRRLLNPHLPQPRMRQHTRLVLAVSAFLIVSGAAAFLVSEYVLWSGPKNGGAVLTALFHSVTARTAGFNTVPMLQIGPLTVQILMVLMLIGGSPGGTAGGMRTTVFAVGLAHLWSQIRMSRRGMIAFNRAIPPELGAQALGLMVLTGIWLTVNFAMLLILQTGSGVSETKLLFELISAFATVGLSLDLTATLTAGAKTLLIVNMFVGRVGLMTAITFFIRPDLRPPSGKPQETILLS
jgi:trk system potassium uptake protein TrkH